MYLRKKGPMGGAPYIDPRLGGVPIFKISVSQLDAKERPDTVCNYPWDLHSSHSSRGHY